MIVWRYARAVQTRHAGARGGAERARARRGRDFGIFGAAEWA